MATEENPYTILDIDRPIGYHAPNSRVEEHIFDPSTVHDQADPGRYQNPSLRTEASGNVPGRVYDQDVPGLYSPPGDLMVVHGVREALGTSISQEVNPNRIFNVNRRVGAIVSVVFAAGALLVLHDREILSHTPPIHVNHPAQNDKKGR